MSTMTVQPRQHSRMSVRDTFRWIRETPAPYWDAEDSTKGRYVAWVGVSALAWTVVGIAGTALVGEGLRGLASLLG